MDSIPGYAFNDKRKKYMKWIAKRFFKMIQQKRGVSMRSKAICKNLKHSVKGLNAVALEV
jgi:hypothetical protein